MTLTDKKNPIERMNAAIAAAKDDANRQLERIRAERVSFEKSPFAPPANCGPVEFARAQAEHHQRGNTLRMKERNFMEGGAMLLLDADKNKSLLVDALAHVKAKAKEFKKSAKPSLYAGVRAKFGRPETDDEPPVRGHVIPPGGPLGKDVALAPEARLEIITREVDQFPNHWTFSRIAAELSALDSILTPQDEPEPPPAFPRAVYVQPARF